MQDYAALCRAYAAEELTALEDRLAELGFFTAPASDKYHGNFAGGLFAHSRQVAVRLCEMTQREGLRWERPVSPFIVGMFHDLCKCDAYLPDGSRFVWNENMLLQGHGEKSVMVLATLLQPTQEEVACIRYHMGAFTDPDEWNSYTNAIHRYPNVLWTHQADMLATHVDMI